MTESNVFWYGDNLDVMREHIADSSVDLIYLDPPFNSQRIYSSFMKEADGTTSQAQRKAFEDYWHWGPEAERAFDDVVHPKRGQHFVPATLRQTMEIFRTIAPASNLLAYLSMMAVRMVELRRVLKQNGSLYLHCDPTASHYLKVMLDALFGAGKCMGEIVWKRTGAHSGTRGWGPIHDTLLFYSKSGDAYTWNPLPASLPQQTVDQWYNNVEEETGRRFNRDNLTGSGVRGGESGKPWRGVDPTAKGRHWAIPGYMRKLAGIEGLKTLESLDALDAMGRIFWPKKEDGAPMFKRYLDESEGVVLQDVVTDISPLKNNSPERTGYPTQKPVELLKRVIAASSNADDLVLDPFCGCGTAVIAAEELGRRWIGIDVTHVAVSVLKKRLESAFPGLSYRVRGEPEDIASARRLAEEKWEEFQAWIVDRVGGMPITPEEEKKVAKKGKDGGMDGLLLFRDDPRAARSHRMIMSVKAGKHLTPDMVDSLHGVVIREKAKSGVLLTAYNPTPGMLNTARACGTYTSEMYPDGRRFPIIQIVSAEEIFGSKWRSLDYPGANTSLKSQPPAGTDGASEELFKPRPPRKTASAPPEQEALPFRPKKKSKKR